MQTPDTAQLEKPIKISQKLNFHHISF